MIRRALTQSLTLSLTACLAASLAACDPEIFVDDLGDDFDGYYMDNTRVAGASFRGAMGPLTLQQQRADGHAWVESGFAELTGVARNVQGEDAMVMLTFWSYDIDGEALPVGEHKSLRETDLDEDMGEEPVGEEIDEPAEEVDVSVIGCVGEEGEWGTFDEPAEDVTAVVSEETRTDELGQEVTVKRVDYVARFEDGQEVRGNFELLP